MSRTITKQPALLQRLRLAGQFSLLIGVGLLATGCSSGSSTDTTSTTNTIEIRIWRMGQAPQDNNLLSRQIKSFKKKYSSAKLNIEFTPVSAATYENDALRSMAARTGPEIWSLPSDWIGDHTPRISTLPDNYFFARDKNGKVAKTGPNPVDQVRELFPAGIVEQILTTDGKRVYGIPTEVEGLMLYYNSDLYSQAVDDFRSSLGARPSVDQIKPVETILSNPPATWRDLVEQAKYLNRRSGANILRSAIALGTADNVGPANDILQLLMLQNGAQVVSSDRRNALFNAPITTPAGVKLVPGEEALKFYASFSNPDSAVYSWNSSMPQAIDAFGQGKVAMIIGYGDIEQQLAIKYPRFDFDKAPVPQNSLTEPAVNLIRFAVDTVTRAPKNDTDKAGAFAFLNTYTEIGSVGSIAGSTGKLSPYKATLEKSGRQSAFAQQVLTGKAVYKRSRTEFDETFRQIIVDTTVNRVAPITSLNVGVEKITTILQKPDSL